MPEELRNDIEVYPRGNEHAGVMLSQPVDDAEPFRKFRGGLYPAEEGHYVVDRSGGEGIHLFRDLVPECGTDMLFEAARCFLLRGSSIP